MFGLWIKKIDPRPPTKMYLVHAISYRTDRRRCWWRGSWSGGGGHGPSGRWQTPRPARWLCPRCPSPWLRRPQGTRPRTVWHTVWARPRGRWASSPWASRWPLRGRPRPAPLGSLVWWRVAGRFVSWCLIPWCSVRTSPTTASSAGNAVVWWCRFRARVPSPARLAAAESCAARTPRARRPSATPRRRSV